MTTIRQTRLAPGAFRCPQCKHIVDSKDVVEIVKDEKKKGKRVCTPCGLDHLRLTTAPKKPPKGPPQSTGQTSLL